MANLIQPFIHDLVIADLPREVCAFGRRCLLDLIGVAACGATTDMSRIMRNHAATQFGAGKRAALQLFDGRPVSPVGAALSGGVTIDAVDAHDGHKLTKGHVGCGVLPAALALADAEGLNDGNTFLTSLVIGYELGTRLGIALHRTAPDYHTSGAWVAVACSALGARALGLDAAQTREAMGIAEYHGPRSQMMRCIDHPTMVKDGSGWGAMAGVSAAYLAAEGFTGAPAITAEDPAVADLWSDLGHRWRILEQYCKPYPVCRWAQPPLQAVLDLRRLHGLRAEQVERIEVTTFHESVRLATRCPTTTEQAQYSTAFPTAAAMVRGRVSVLEIGDGAFQDPEILRLSESMVFTESEACNAAFPARRIAQVTLLLKDGRRLVSEPTEAQGDPEAPLSAEQVREKYHTLADPVLGVARSERAADAVADLGITADLPALTTLITAPIVVGDAATSASLVSQGYGGRERVS